MQYIIHSLPGEPSFDNLGVIKLRCDLSVDINSRIYGQAQMGRNKDLLFVRIWSFETQPDENSCVSAKLQYGGHTISISACFDGRATLTLDGIKCENRLTAYLIGGEDLQGKYWGAVMLLPLNLLFDCFKINESMLPVTLNGNIMRKNPAVSFAALPNESAEFILMP